MYLVDLTVGILLDYDQYYEDDNQYYDDSEDTDLEEKQPTTKKLTLQEYLTDVFLIMLNI